jgi:hypothetical protein
MNPFAAQIMAQTAQQMAPAPQVSQISTPMAQTAQPYDFSGIMPQIQNALQQQQDRQRQAMSLAQQAAAMQAPMMERPQLGRREAGIAGGIAALGSLLGARNAVPALGRFMDNRQQRLVQDAQADYERRAMEAARQARIMAAQQAGLMQEAQGFGSLAESLQGQAKLGMEAYDSAQDRALKAQSQAFDEEKFYANYGLDVQRLDIDARRLVMQNEGEFTKMVRDLTPLMGEDAAAEYATTVARNEVLKQRAEIADTEEQTRLRPIIAENNRRLAEMGLNLRQSEFNWRQQTDARDFDYEATQDALEMQASSAGDQAKARQDEVASIQQKRLDWGKAYLADEKARVNAEIKRLEGVGTEAALQAVANHRARLNRNALATRSLATGTVPQWMANIYAREVPGGNNTLMRQPGDGQGVPRKRGSFPLPPATAGGSYKPLSPF